MQKKENVDSKKKEKEKIKQNIEKKNKTLENIAKSNNKSAGNHQAKINYHLIVLGAILVIFSLAVFILLRWNRGIDLEIDPNEDTSEFDVEPLDMIIPLHPSALEGRDDDGVTTILCLGNNPFTDETGEKGLAARIAEKTDGVVYNGGFPDSTVVCKNAVYDPLYTRDVFNLYYVTQALINHKFSPQLSASEFEEDQKYRQAAEALEKVDMEKVDAVIVMYDTTDYNMLSPADNPSNEYDVVAFTGALRTSIENLREAYPHLSIYLMSHTYARYKDENGKLLNGTITDLGNGNVPHYLIMESNVALDCGISFIDNYFGTINEKNYKDYMSDHMHYNDAGRELLAQRIADIINEDIADRQE